MSGPHTHTPAAHIKTRPLMPFARFGVVFGWGLRRLVRTRKFVWTGAIVVAVGALAGLSFSGRQDAAYRLWEFLGIHALGICIPLIALVLTAGGFGEEVAEQTLVFHLVRPVSRTTLFLARFVAGLGPAIAASAAMCLLAAVLSGVAVTLTTVGSLLLSAAIGTTVVSSVYYALSALFRRGLVAGLIYTFVIEGFFAHIPGSIQKLALTHHIRSIFHQLCDADFARLSERVSGEWIRGNTAVMRSPRSLKDLIPAEPWSTVSDALLVCGIVTVLALFLGAWTIRRRDFALKD